MGGRFSHTFLHQYAHELLPTPREWLDAHSRGRAVYLRESTGHAAIANTRALELLGATATTPDPRGGSYMRDSAGALTGVLTGEADMISRRKWPDYTPAQYDQAVRHLGHLANSFGLTGLKDADVSEPIARAYRDADLAGQLTLRVSACLGTNFGHRDTALDYGDFERQRNLYASPRCDVSNVKLYMDGIPAQRTACFIEPYLDVHGKGGDHRGQLFVSRELLNQPQLLNQDLAHLDRLGFTVKMHSLGDGSVRAALDAVAHARSTNGASGLRQEVAHALFVHAEDMHRFVELDIVADLSPYVWNPSALPDDFHLVVGEKRMKQFAPIKALVKSGARVLGGSDWRSASASVNPWVGLGTMVTRRDPGDVDRTGPVLGTEHAVTVSEALVAFTVGGAAALGKEGVCGTLEVGMSADVAVVDRDIFAGGVDLCGTKVEVTVFEGKVVYERGEDAK